MAENESLDGATTALHRRIEELTAELERSQRRVHLEVENNKGVNHCNVELQEQLATERAAREQAEADRELLRGAAKTFETACSRAELERDTALALSTERYQELCRQSQRATDAETALASALARVKELEASNRALRMTNSVEEADADDQRERRRAAETALASEQARADGYYAAWNEDVRALKDAETALASARAVIEEAYHYQNRMPTDFVLRARSWLTSHPAPVAAPCAGCARLSAAIDQAIRDMLSGGHPFEKGVAKAINDLRAAQKKHS